MKMTLSKYKKANSKEKQLCLPLISAGKRVKLMLNTSEDKDTRELCSKEKCTFSVCPEVEGSASHLFQ